MTEQLSFISKKLGSIDSTIGLNIGPIVFGLLLNKNIFNVLIRSTGNKTETRWNTRPTDATRRNVVHFELIDRHANEFGEDFIKVKMFSILVFSFSISHKFHSS